MLTVWARRLSDGKTIALDKLIRLRVVSSLSSPAQGVSLEAAVDEFPGDLGRIMVKEGIRTVFTGQVDRQTSSLSADGRRISIDARSKAALLLDNEAVPSSLAGVRLTTVFNRFIAPYGFLLQSVEGNRALPLYVVNKGLSEWEAFTNFVRRAYGRTPYVSGDQVIVDHPGSLSALVIGGAGLPFTKLEHTFEPYHVISRVVLRDEDGYYRSAVRNTRADDYDIQRKRYVIPANEFTDYPVLDANQRIRRSMLKLHTVSVELPGVMQIAVGRKARIADENLNLSGLMVDEVIYNQNQQGVTTGLSLVSSRYYD